MSSQPTPPRWADRFLAWYCNPELLEEIQGDAHELYFERLKNEGERAANFKYIWDVIRFCRVSNVKRPEEFSEPGAFGIIWNLNMKIAIRNALRNKTVFFVKLSALAICLAFTFLLTGFVINELSYDHHYTNYNRIYRVGTHVELQGKSTDYAVSPLPLGRALVEEVPGIEMSSRFMFVNAPRFKVGDVQTFGITTYSADTNFLRMFHQVYIQGTPAALDGPNMIVLTESCAKKIFGDTQVVGKSIDFGWTMLEVTAVVMDPPLNTHMAFEALMSWDTFKRRDEWDNLNAYTYIQIAPGMNMTELDTAISAMANDYLKQVAEEYDLKYAPITQRIDQIHLSAYMDEDFAPKRSRNYIYIIISVVVLFVFTGLFNYLNLALAELTAQVKKITVLRIFGGIHADHRKVAFTDSLLCVLIVAPVIVIIMILFLSYPGLLPVIDAHVWTNPVFIAIVASLVFIILLCSRLNSIMISKSELMLSSLKGKSQGSGKGLTVRKILVAAQLSFSIIMIGLITVIVDQFRYVDETDKGFSDQDVLVITRLHDYKSTIALEEAIRQMTGVVSVAGSSFYPDGGVETKEMFEIESDNGMKNRLVNYINCEEDYISVLDLKLVAGRFFDQEHSTDKGAFVINETAAKQFGWDNPLGKKIGVYDLMGEVIGVVKDFHFESMHAKIEPVIMFVPGEQWGLNFVYVKTEPLKSDGLLLSIEREYKKVMPDLPFDFGYLDARYRGLYKNDYEIRDIFRWGLVISMIVSGLGIFSISALLLSLRTREMGIRKVVGAGNAHLFAMHLKPFVVFFLIALAIGLPVIFYLSGKWLNNFAYHIDLNAGYFILPGVVTIVIILLASVYHALRGANVNPVDILKQE